MIGKIIQDYQIIELIGQGGMGDVFLAQHTLIGKKAAIKVLKSELLNDETVKTRFINEAKALSDLSHSNIVTLYNFTFDHDTFFMIMEYAEGIPLDVYISRYSGPIPERRCLLIFQKILDAFSYAHKKGIVHRDIKPSNIILSSEDIPKILDFGIAKMMKSDSRITKTGSRIGSLAYMSPEQILGYDVDTRTDIYSLGLKLFEMLSGKMPYNVDTDSEYLLQDKIVREPLPSVKEMYPYVSDSVAEVIKKATEKDRQKRFQSCYEFNLALYDASRGGLSPNQYQTQQNISTGSYTGSAQQNLSTQIISPAQPVTPLQQVPPQTTQPPVQPVIPPNVTAQQPETPPVIQESASQVTPLPTPPQVSQPPVTPPPQKVTPTPAMPYSTQMPVPKKSNKAGLIVAFIFIGIFILGGIIATIVYMKTTDTGETNSSDSAKTSNTINQDSIKSAEQKAKDNDKRIRDSIRLAAIQDSIDNVKKEDVIISTPPNKKDPIKKEPVYKEPVYKEPIKRDPYVRDPGKPKDTGKPK